MIHMVQVLDQQSIRSMINRKCPQSDLPCFFLLICPRLFLRLIFMDNFSVPNYSQEVQISTISGLSDVDIDQCKTIAKHYSVDLNNLSLMLSAGSTH